MLATLRRGALPVLHGLGDVGRDDLLYAGQVGDCAGEAQEAVVGRRRQRQLANGSFHQALTGPVKRAELADLVDTHLGVERAADAVGEAGLLTAPRRCDAFGDHRRRLPTSRGGQALVAHPRHFEVDLDALA